MDYVQMLGCLIHGTRVPADPGGGELEKNPQKGTQAVSPPSSAHTATFYGTREASGKCDFKNTTHNTL